MKAIIIEGVLKFQNSFKEFNGTVGLKDATDQQWYDWGFREYITPTITNLQKLGEVFFDSVSDTYTFPVINKTQAEIDADTKAAIENAVNQKLNQYESDGDAYFRYIRNYVQRNYNDAVITKAQFLNIRQTLGPALQPLKDGNWGMAQTNINAITPPTNVKLLFLYNKVKTAIDKYITENNIN